MEQIIEKQCEQILCSVIIRTKDRPRHLYRSLESVREQERKPDEVIVVNDGGESIESVIQLFSDLPTVLIVNKVSQGRSVAGNIGVDAASGDVICFLDDDDRFFKDHLKRLELSMLRFDAKVAYSGSRIVLKDILGESNPEQTQVIGEFNEPFDPDRLAFENYIPLNTLLIDRKLFLGIGGFDPAFSLFEDWDLLFRLSMKTKFYHLDRVTSEYTIWGKSHQITLSSKTDHWRDAYNQMFKKNFLAFSDIEKVKRMADYWILSQERRSKIKELERKLENYVGNDNIITNISYDTDGIGSQVQTIQNHIEILQSQFQMQKNESDKKIDQIQARYNKKLNILKSALKRDKSKKELFQKIINEQDRQINEQNRQIALGVGNHAIRSLFLKEISGIGHFSSNIIKDNYYRLANWIKSNELSFSDDINALSNQTEQLHLLKREMYILEERIKSLLNQLHNSKLRKIWRGIPTPQVSSILEKNIEISHLLSDVVANCDNIIAFHNSKDNPNLFLSKNKQTLKQIAIEDIAEYVPVFEAFAGNDEQSEIMVKIHFPEIQTIPVPLKNNTRICFSIYSAYNDFFCISIMLATYIRINTCNVKISIFESGNEIYFKKNEVNNEKRQLIEPLRKCEFNAIEVLDNQYYTVNFNPISDSKGKTYKIEIVSPNATDEQHIAVWCYLANNLMFGDGSNQNKNMIFSGEMLYPLWLRQLLTGIPLSHLFAHRLRAGENKVKHIFCIYNTPESFISGIGMLQLLLLELGQMAEQKKQSILFVIYGTSDSTTQDYCLKNSIDYLVIEPSISQERRIIPFLFQYILHQINYIDNDGLIWFVDSGMIPQNDLMENAEEHFKTYQDTGLLFPLVQTNNNKIAHAFGQITRNGSINNFTLGDDVLHPSNGYVREIDATDAQCFAMSAAVMKNFVMKNTQETCLAVMPYPENTSILTNIDDISLIAYQTVCYQTTELIWQLKERGFTIRFDPTVVFRGEGFKDKISDALLDSDRLIFLKRWQSKLFHKPAIYDDLSVLLNPDRKKTALVVDMTLPTFDEDSGSLRMYELLRLLIQIGIKVTFFPDNLDSKPKYRRALERFGIEVFCGSYGIADALDSRKYDIIILSRVEIGYRYMNLVKLLNPKAKIYYDTVDIHYVRELRRAEIENSEKLCQQAVKTRQKELANCIMADVVFTVTEDDKKHLLKELPSLNCFVLPNIHRQLQFNISWENTDGLVFIGSYKHPPNEDAVFYFVENIFPIIRDRIPEIRLYLIGSHMREQIKALASEHIRIVGWVEEVETELVKRRVMVSYLRYGAGMKGKIGQAMSLGLPVVSTSIGAEGMGLRDGETIMVADNPDSFAEKVCNIYKDKVVWETISQNAKNYIYSQYGTEAVKEKLKAFLDVDLKHKRHNRAEGFNDRT